MTRPSRLDAQIAEIQKSEYGRAFRVLGSLLGLIVALFVVAYLLRPVYQHYFGPKPLSPAEEAALDAELAAADQWAATHDELGLCDGALRPLLRPGVTAEQCTKIIDEALADNETARSDADEAAARHAPDP